MPSWVRIVKEVGFPITVALLLLGMLIGVVPSNLQAVPMVRELMERHIRETTGQRWYLRQICRNTAQNDADRAVCDRPTPGDVGQ